ncbi:hypothetical protein AB7M42_007576 [Bradyrhizobium diazoefficiens]
MQPADPGRERRPRLQPKTGEMIEPLAAAGRRWWRNALKTAAPANVRPGISMIIAASCRLMDTPPITSWRDPIAAMMASPWPAAGHTAGASSMSCMLQEARKWQRRRSNGWQSSGRLRRPCAAKVLTHALPHASKPPRRSSQISSISGSTPCGGSPANQNWPRQSAMPSHAAPSSNASSPTAALSSTPTSSSAPSGHRQLRERKPLRGQRRRRTNLGDHRNTATDGKDE